MRNYFSSLWLLLDIAGTLVITSTLAALGAALVILLSPALAAIVDADELSRAMRQEEKR